LINLLSGGIHSLNDDHGRGPRHRDGRRGRDQGRRTLVMRAVACFGETMLRLSPDFGEALEGARTLNVHVGGSESNVAVALARLGVRAQWMSALPDDALGRTIAGELRRHGVSLDGVMWRGGRAGLYFVDFGPPPRGTDVIYDRKSSAFAECPPDAIDWSVLDNCSLLHVSGITPALPSQGAALFDRAREEAARRGLQVSADVNYRSTLWAPDRARASLDVRFSGVDLLFVGREDLLALWPEVRQAGPNPSDWAAEVRRLLDCSTVVITLGPDGAGAMTDSGWTDVPSVPVTVVDPLGRGDALAAGYLYRWLGEGDPKSCLEYACAMAALAQTYRGDLSFTTLDALERMLGDRGRDVRR
jgi:2-dehydro-3-deoxygluconokinase